MAQSPWTEQELQVYYDIIAANIFDGLKEIAVGLKKANKEVHILFWLEHRLSLRSFILACSSDLPESEFGF